MAKITSKIEFAGAGCIVQGVGLLLLFWWPFGTIAGIALMIYGSIISKKYKCGSCGNRLDDQYVKICPTCRDTLES